MKRVLLFVLFVGLVFRSMAFDFEVGGIYYDILTDNTCEVVIGDGYKSESIVIPKSVSYQGVVYDVVRIGADAFYGQTMVQSVTIPASVTAIGSEAFIHCKGLTTIEVEAGNPNYSSYQGALYNKQRTCLIRVPIGKKEYTISSGVYEIGEDAFHLCRSLTRLTIPSGVIRIGDNAFAGCDSLTTLDIANGVELIGAYAFSGCKALTSLTIPNSVNEIGRNAFSFCTSLKSVVLPIGMLILPDGIFNGCTSLKTVKVPERIAAIGDYAFAQCDSMQTLQLPSLVTSIGSNAFYGCGSLESFEIPENVEAIGSDAFEYCTKIETIKIPEKVVTLGDRTFNGCIGLSYIDVAEGNGAFKSFKGTLYDYQLKRLIKVPSMAKRDSIPETAMQVSPYAYFKCGNLTRVKMPESIAMIGEWAFVGCGSLDSVYMTKPIDLSETYLPGGGRTLYVPSGKKQEFEASLYYIDQYSKFKTIEEYDVNPTAIIKHANVVGNDRNESVIYTLQGVRREREILKKGVYIIDGKKVVVK